MKRDRYTPKVEDEKVENTIEVVERPKVKKEVFVEHQVRSTIPKLNIRIAPTPEAEAIDSISKGQAVTIIAEQDGWGRLKFLNGWVNLKYTERA